MVKVRAITRDPASAEWLEVVTVRLSQTERQLVARADLWAHGHYGDSLHPAGTRWIEHVRAAVGILGSLRVDGDALAATFLLGVPVSSREQREALAAQFGPAIAALVEGVASMAQIQVLRGRVESGSRQTDRAAQLESLRKMLLAMVQDVRVVLIKLADQVQVLRNLAATGDAQARGSAAGDTMDLFAPLANRLGVWQIKWELEDLAFRCLEPHTYKNLARSSWTRSAWIARTTSLTWSSCCARNSQPPASPAKSRGGQSTSTASGARCRARTWGWKISSTCARCVCW
jgi:GTP pyrophosphokinase